MPSLRGPMTAEASHAGLADEDEIIALARTGDAAAFSQLMSRYEGKIFRLAQHITQNREDAEDVLQEAFLKAFRSLRQFDQRQYKTVKPWLVKIATNSALDYLKQAKY